jgi:hypothetical protein
VARLALIWIEGENRLEDVGLVSMNKRFYFEGTMINWV